MSGSVLLVKHVLYSFFVFPPYNQIQVSKAVLNLIGGYETIPSTDF